MGWERRGDRLYLYRKRRIGGTVRSEYCGSGETAGLISLLWQEERDERDAERADRRAERERLEELDRTLKSFGEAADLAARGALIAAGFRQHNRGQWRRKRVRSEPPRAD
jgi:hypothetical protein